MSHPVDPLHIHHQPSIKHPEKLMFHFFSMNQPSKPHSMSHFSGLTGFNHHQTIKTAAFLSGLTIETDLGLMKSQVKTIKTTINRNQPSTQVDPP